MNSHFKKIRKGNTGKIGVWDIKNSKYDVLLTPKNSLFVIVSFINIIRS